jgi:hypothetical protein
MPYMNPLTPEDLVAINELSELTWSWSLHYWTERGEDHGAFWISFYNPVALMHYRVDGTSVSEIVKKIFNMVESSSKVV